MPLSACPADLLSYAGFLLCIVLTPASLVFHQLFGSLTVSLNDYFRITQSTWLLSQLEINLQFLCNARNLHESFCFSCPESRVWVLRPLLLPLLGELVAIPHHLCYL